jgi:hypothetical protein
VASPPVALIGDAVTLIGDAVALIGEAVALIGDVVALVGGVVVLSVLGSLFLAAAIVRAAMSHGTARPRAERDPARDRAERARRLQEELRVADRPNITGNMGGGSGPGTG